MVPQTLPTSMAPTTPLDQLVSAITGRRVHGLRVELRSGGIVLRGRADGPEARQLAQRAAVAVLDLPVVANEIAVTEGYGPDDRWPRVLVASSDEGVRTAVRLNLVEHGCAVAIARGGTECVAALDEWTPDVVVLDADLLWGGADGVLAALDAGGTQSPPVVLLAGRFAPAPDRDVTGHPSVVATVAWPAGSEALAGAVSAAARTRNE